MVSLRNISKKYGKLKVLEEVSVEFVKGGIIGILGPNGSGKTTLLKSILGLVLPESGQILVMGTDIRSTVKYREKIAYLPQIARFPENITVSELFRIVADMRELEEDWEDLISYFGLETYLEEKLGNLSGGTRQKVNVVLTFMCKSEILILDEPTVGLDPVSTVKLKKLIEKSRNDGKLILLTTHIMGVVEELADEIIYLLEGKVVYRGSVTSLTTSAELPNLELAIVNEIHGKHVVDI